MKLTPLENWIMQKTEIGLKNRSALEEYQLRKIKETINYVKTNSPFYKQLLKDINVSNINSKADFESLPFTFPDDINKAGNGFLCIPQRDVKRIVTLRSSGTSGDEKRIYFSEEDIELTVDFFKYGMSSLVDESDRVLVLLPGNSYGSIGDLLKKALAELNIYCMAEGILADAHKAAETILQYNISCIVGIPLQVLYLSRIERKTFSEKIRKVLLSTDYVPDVIKEELSNICGCKVFNHYGMTEMGYGGGVECEALNGCHMREGDLYFEIVDPDTGVNVPDGQYGEIVFTTLTRKAMPLVRYRTGDIASFSPQICSCGTFLKTMKKVLGRSDNKVLIDDEHFIYMREMDESILGLEAVADYKVRMYKRDIMVIEAVLMPGADFNEVKNKITTNMKKLINANFNRMVQLEVIKSSQSRPFAAHNSMIKRKIIFED